jgi:hypothetical protein
LTEATLHSDLGEPCPVNYGGKTVVYNIKKGGSLKMEWPRP